MIGVGRGLLRDLPGGVPADRMLIHQRAHQLHHRQRRMGVVQLNRVVATEVVDAMAGGGVPAEDVSHGAGDEEIFLDEAQLPSGFRRIRRIEHF